MIDFYVPAGARVLELGGGSNRHPKATVNVDVRPVQGVDFTIDFNKEEWLELSSEEFDIVYACFVLEYVSWRVVPNFLKQVFRVLKSGGKAIFVIPNTQAQMKYILSKPEFDGDEGSMLFGTLDYPENSHRAAFSPGSATKLFTEAGFTNIVISPFGALATDMIVEAAKPATQASEPVLSPLPSSVPSSQSPSPPVPKSLKPASERFNLQYFERYQGGSFLWDFPTNYLIAQRIRERSPENVLALGEARGYVLKRLQDEDEGIQGMGIDVSQHAYLTRVCDPIKVHDLIQPWPVADKSVDLAYSMSFLEHIHEGDLPLVMSELRRVSSRGLHGVTLEGKAPNHDPERITLKSIDFWKSILPEGHEAVDIREISAGELPQEIINGDGRIKLNIGSAWTMFWNGWTNMDVIDGDNWARAYKYKFLRHDVRNGIPTATGVVDCLSLHHVAEHFSYEELTRLLKECRRVIRPDGCMRIVVPDAETLTYDYHNKPGLSSYDEMNVGTAKAATFAGKLWSLLGHGHSCFLDEETLFLLLTESGWTPHKASFRQTLTPSVKRILTETIEMDYGGTSLFVDATPTVG